MRTVTERAYNGVGNWRPTAVANVWVKKSAH